MKSWAHPGGTSQSMPLNVSCHQEHEFITPPPPSFVDDMSSYLRNSDQYQTIATNPDSTTIHFYSQLFLNGML